MRMQMFGIFLFREYTNTTWRYAIVQPIWVCILAHLFTEPLPHALLRLSAWRVHLAISRRGFLWCRTRILLGIMILLFCGAIALLASSSSIRPGT